MTSATIGCRGCRGASIMSAACPGQSPTPPHRHRSTLPHARPRVLLDVGQCGGAQAGREFRVAQDAQRGGGHRFLVAAGDQQSRDVVAQNEGHAADIGADDRHAACHRFQHRIGHVVDPARIDHHRGRPIKRRHLVAVEPAAEIDSPSNPELRCKRAASPPDRIRRRSDARRALPGDERKGAQRGRNVVNGLQIARDDDAALAGAIRRPPDGSARDR